MHLPVENLHIFHPYILRKTQISIIATSRRSCPEIEGWVSVAPPCAASGAPWSRFHGHVSLYTRCECGHRGVAGGLPETGAKMRALKEPVLQRAARS
jgi:hypothetical protein